MANANGNLNNINTNSYVLDNIVTYDNTFGRHQVTGTLVATRDRWKEEGVNTTGSNFAANSNTALGIYGLSKADVKK